MKTFITTNRLLRIASLILTLSLIPCVALAQHTDEDGHDHSAAVKPKQKSEHPGHEHATEHEEAKGDAHEDHGEHEEHAVRFDAATLDEFGIVLKEAGPGVIDETVRLPGEVVFNADRVAHVTPSVSGVVREVKHSVGDRVKAGEMMAVLSSRDLAAARSEYLASQARQALAKAILARDEKLLEQRIGTERQVLEARQAVRENEIAMNLAEHNLHALGQDEEEVAALAEAADTALSTYELRSPLDGIVIAREATRGEVISQEADEPPFIVADLSSVWVNLTVYQRDLIVVEPGMSVRIEFGHGIPAAEGTITFVSPSLDETTRTATARVVLENTNGQWRPGLFVTGHVTAGEESAGGGHSPIRVAGNRRPNGGLYPGRGWLRAAPVVLGREGKNSVEIVRGLEAGERYVAENGFAVKAEMNKASFGDGHNH